MLEENNKRIDNLKIYLALICVVCAIIGGVSGGLTAAVINRNRPETVNSSGEDTTLDTQGGSDSAQIAPTLSETDIPETLTEAEETSAEATEPPTEAPPIKLSTKEIYANCVDSVVRITGETYVTSSFFGQTTKATVSGSGFIITGNGYIVTNNHVVDGTENLMVELHNGESYSATIVGGESSNDVAVIKIDAANLSPVTIGDSDALEVGDELVIIGNPLGELTYSLTTGVVSALNRQIDSTDSGSINMFQTNATINSGNSGGPAFDANGEVVGIAAAKYASSDIEGLAFCIPINDVKKYVSDIIEYGYVKGLSLLGVTVQTVTSTMASRYGLASGAYVVAMDPAIQGAGMELRDVIVEFDGAAVASASELQTAIKTKKPGEIANIGVYRSGTQYTLSVTLNEKVPASARTSYTGVYDI